MPLRPAYRAGDRESGPAPLPKLYTLGNDSIAAPRRGTLNRILACARYHIINLCLEFITTGDHSTLLGRDRHQVARPKYDYLHRISDATGLPSAARKLLTNRHRAEVSTGIKNQNLSFPAVASHCAAIGNERYPGPEEHALSLPTISIRYVVRLLELAERDGANAEELLASAGMDPIVADQPDVRVPTDCYYRLWSATLKTLNDASFPLRLAAMMDTASFDALGFAVVTSASYGDALERIQRHLPFVTDGASWTIEREKGSAVLTFTQHSERTPEHRFVDEFSLAHLVIVGRNLTSTPWQLDEVRFRSPEPDDTDELRAFFGARLRFGAATTSLHFPAQVLDLPFSKANPSMAAFFDRYVESVLLRSHPEQDFITSVRKLLAESLLRNAYTPEDLARQLAMSPRTLRRRLSSKGLTYSSLLDQVRRDLAEQHLRDRRLSLGDIAFALGYSEPSTFHRAFRRWTGATPAGYRASHRPDRSNVTDL